MVFYHGEKLQPKIGTRRTYSKFLWTPLRHEDKTYMWCMVSITEVWSKDYISVYAGINGWKIVKVELK